MSRVVFLQVASNVGKQQRICEAVSHQFHQKQPILIAVSSDEAAKYLDELLWRYPEESFIPHCIAEKPMQDFVVITTSSQNINGAKVIFNLCPHLPEMIKDAACIFDLFDLTHPQKEELSRKKKAAYEQAGFLIEIRS